MKSIFIKTQMKKQPILCFLLLFILFQSCVVYQKTPVSFEDAINKKKAKLITTNGREIILQNIIKEDSIYYGVLIDQRVPLPPEQIQSIYLEDINRTAKNIYSTQFLGDFYGGIGLKYERIVYQKNVVQLIPRIGVGLNVLFEVAPIFSFGGSIALGRNNSKFELGASYLLLYSGDVYSFPVFNLGYRNQKPVKGFFFSLGLYYSLEDALFTIYPSGSIGLSF
jgi:hypothetical protein